MIAPRLVDDLESYLYPLPSRSDFVKTYGDEMWKSREVVLAQFGAKMYADVPPERFGDLMVGFETVERATAQKYYTKLWGILRSQEFLQSAAGFVAPMLAVRSVSASMAGTDLAHWQDFSDAAEQYRYMFESYSNAEISRNGGDQGYNYRASPDFWRGVPKFQYELPVAAEAYSTAWPAFIAIGIALMLAVVFAAIGVARLPRAILTK
jgi:ABC-2 type transport system permease protein